MVLSKTDPFGRPRIKILLVDDLKNNLLALEGLLRRDDVEIFQASSGESALEFLFSNDFALAFVDVQMPGMSGFELAELMRGTNKSRHVPIIFVSATAKDLSFAFKGYESGAVDFLLKPLNSHAVKSKANVFIELYRQKNEIKTAEIKFRGLLENAADAIVITDDEGRIEIVNRQAEAMFGYERSELIGQPMEMLMPERFRVAHIHHRTGFTAYPAIRPMSRGHEFFGRRKNGAEFSIDISLSPLSTETGTLISAAIRDITERRTLEKAQDALMSQLKKTQAELEQALLIRDEFMSIASHELKTPLTAMKIQAQFMRRGIEKGDSSVFSRKHVEAFTDQTERQVVRLVRMVNDMLDVARIRTGNLTLEHERFDLRESIRESVLQMHSQFVAAGYSDPMIVECEPSTGVWDRMRIEQVIINLLTNAIKYGNQKPIRIEVKCSKSHVTFSVRDHGAGISLDAQGKIFNRFERAETTSKARGLGLGLFISREIVTAHGGKIWVESTPGEGSAFFVELPLSDQNETKGL